MSALTKDEIHAALTKLRYDLDVTQYTLDNQYRLGWKQTPALVKRRNDLRNEIEYYEDMLEQMVVEPNVVERGNAILDNFFGKRAN